MAAPIFKHNPTIDPRDDPNHPIPSLAVIDVMTIKKGGGADLTIVIASPLQGDKESLTRLQDKIEGYLGYILSKEFQLQAGSPSPDNTSIIVKVHPDSDQLVFTLLKKSAAWVLNNRATLKVELLTPYEMGKSPD